MNVFGSKADTLPARSHGHSRTPGSGELGAVPLALVINAEILVGFRFFPARIALHRNARGADHLVRREVERDVVGGELAVELAPRVKWVVFPAVAVVHHHLGIPLREIEAPALAPLAKPLALLGRVGGGPARARPESVQVLVDGEVAQRVGRAVHVADARVAGEHSRRLIQRRGDPICDLLLPVGGCVAGDEQKQEGKHGGGEATATRAGWGARRTKSESV